MVADSGEDGRYGGGSGDRGGSKAEGHSEFTFTGSADFSISNSAS